MAGTSRFAVRRRGGKISRTLSAAAVAAVCAAPAYATTFTYTPNNGTTHLWSDGTGWSATPVGAADTTLVFNSTLTAGQANTNTNNLAGAFDLNILTFQGTGVASGAGPTVTIASSGSSTGLNFINNGATLPVINLNATTGTVALTYTVSQNINLGANLTLTGNGSASYLFSGAITGSGMSLTKSGSSSVSLSGGASTYSGGTTVSGGNFRIGADSTGAAGAVTAGPFGTGPISLAASTAITSRDTSARVINNALTFDGNAQLGSTSTTTNGALTFGAVSMSGSRTLTIPSGVTFPNGLAESAASSLTKTGAGTLTIAGASGYTGSTAITGGVLRFNAATALGGAGASLTVNADTAVAIGFTPNQAFLDRIVGTSSGAIGFTTDPSGFNYANLSNAFIGAASGSSPTFSGAVPVGAGNTYRLGGGGGTLTVSATNALTGGNSLVVGNAIGGVVILSAANDFTGAATIKPNTILRLGHSNSIGASSGLVVENVGRLELGNGVVANVPATINGSGNNNSGAIQLAPAATTAEYAGNILLGSNDARVGVNSTVANSTLILSGVVDDGANTFNFNIRNVDGSVAPGGATILTGANTYGGSTGVVVGTVRIDGGDNRLPAGTTLVLGANNNTTATFDLNGRNQQVAGITRSGTTTANLITNTKAATASTFTVANPGAVAFDGVITDTFGSNGATLALVKSGAGTLTMNRAMTHRGGTTVAEGTLTGTVANVMGGGNVTVASGATLSLTGAATNYLADSAFLILAGGTPTVNLGFTGTDVIDRLSLDGGSSFVEPGVYGSATSGAPNVLSQFTGAGTVTVNSVPEPATLGGVALAAVGLLARRRR